MTSSKHDHANYYQFAQNFDMAYRTIQRVSVPNLKLLRQMNTELRTKEAGEFSTHFYRIREEGRSGRPPCSFENR